MCQLILYCCHIDLNCMICKICFLIMCNVFLYRMIEVNASVYVLSGSLIECGHLFMISRAEYRCVSNIFYLFLCNFLFVALFRDLFGSLPVYPRKGR